MGDELELIQFRYSHYNEKARWALDFKGLPHRRTSLLPGPHMGKVKKLTGQTSTPVLRLGGRYVAGSAAIIAALEQAHPEPALYPAELASGRGRSNCRTGSTATLAPTSAARCFP